eukprot:CAMPEP_0184331202 /NCGR_PEP_ID=MMETSP1089-20130417/517_1 /TAXON_ID=38269 ORGANISM="Gloeochaete wittrockiana, Strain SAG46.84" /NCGR_SAMPLE_ID=MMETSP1089 /ASSEMBLY_ACC=CAM_ASM_000445 /LENGTH=191 /DNA_ID=CAMNT_0026653965 /DNA_START=326 /DNA_END=901 /DNA_ORIENTATION=+
MSVVPALFVASPSGISTSTGVPSVSTSSLSSRVASRGQVAKSSLSFRSSFLPGSASFFVPNSFSFVSSKVSVPEIVAFNEEWYDRGILDSSRFPNKLETESFYGFGKNAEQFNGRAAMIGFALGMLTEVLTGKGIFGQLGITSHPDQVRMMAVLVSTWIATPVLHSLYAVNKDRVDQLLKVGKYANPEDLD